MKYLRRVKGCSRKDRIRSEDIRSELQIPPLMDFIEHRQLSWWDHLHRTKEDIPVKRIWEAKPFGKRRRGRPKKTWDSVIHKILEKRGTTWRDAKKLAQNKKQWNEWM
nr:unnamed protein product [Callosobruchus chinensis]